MELSVSAENKMQLYQQLQILMNEVNVTLFSNKLDKFFKQWSTKEHDSFLTFQPTTTTGQVLYSTSIVTYGPRQCISTIYR